MAYRAWSWLLTLPLCACGPVLPGDSDDADTGATTSSADDSPPTGGPDTGQPPTSTTGDDSSGIPTTGDPDTDTDPSGDPNDTDPPPMPADCLVGDILVTGPEAPAQLAALAGVECIVGSLRITDAKLTDLDDLAALSVIGVDLQIIRTSLPSLAGLGKLQAVGHLDIDGNPALLDLEALSSLTTITTELRIVNNASLSHLGIESLNSAQSINISDNAALVKLEGLNSLEVLNQVTIAENPVMLEIGGLGALSKVEWIFTLADLPALTSVASLGGLDSVGELGVTRVDALTGFDGMKSLNTVDLFIVADNAKLVDFTGLGALTSVTTSMIVNRNPSLQRFTGLGALTSVDSLSIEENDALIDLQGLEALAAAGDITIVVNAGLTSLAGLSGLVSVEQALNVSFNPELGDIDALLPGGGGSLQQADPMGIIGNPKLPTCAAIAVRDAVKPQNVCIDQNLDDACEDDCFVMPP